MSHTKFMAVGGAALALVTGLAISAPGNPGPMPDPVYVITHTKVPAVPVPPEIPPVNPPQIPVITPPGTEPAYTLPNTNDSYAVMCEQGGLTFQLNGGLLFLDPDTLQIVALNRSVPRPSLAVAVPGPVNPAVDLPDRYEAANCSGDQGRTWGRVLLDFYAPNFGASSGVNTGYESLVLGDQGGEPIEDQDANEFSALMEAMQKMLGDPAGALPIPAPSDLPNLPALPTLPTLPSPLYTIDVRYKGPLGEYISTSSPGVVGVPSAIALVNGNGNSPETLMVSINPSQTVSGDGTVSSTGYSLNIQRVTTPNVTAGCNALEADVKVRLLAANPQAPGYPNNASGAIELGYETTRPSLTWAPATSVGRAPSSFTIKYEGSAATTGPTRSDFLVELSQTASCGYPGAIGIVGGFKDQGDPATSSDDVDLAMNLQVPVTSNWKLTRKTSADGKLLITSVAERALGQLSVSGVNKGRNISARLARMPASISVCSQQGNGCNQPWRMDRASKASFNLRVRDENGKRDSLEASYAESEGGGELDVNLSLSEVNIDLRAGTVRPTDLWPLFPTDEYPMWFYFDTADAELHGYYHSKDGNRRLDIDIPGTRTRAAGREIVVKKKFYGLRLYNEGYLTCSPGFSIRTDLLSSKIAGYILGSGLCRSYAF